MHKYSDPEYMTVGLAARSCGVSNTTVLRWIKKGDLLAFRLPAGHYRIERETFMKFLGNGHIPFSSLENRGSAGIDRTE